MALQVHLLAEIENSTDEQIQCLALDADSLEVESIVVCNSDFIVLVRIVRPI